MKLILGSASLRRQELLKRISTEFEVVVSNFDEQSIEFNGNCETYVTEIAKGKVLDVINKVNDEAVVIGCDTIVYFNDKILGKPNGEKEAFEMLSKLSGNVHKVYSGIFIMNSITGDFRRECVCTEVKFSKLTTEQIEKYIKTGDPLDKAGAYGIQGDAAVFVEEIHGCYYSVVGLPLNKLNYLLGDMGVNLNKE